MPAHADAPDAKRCQYPQIAAVPVSYTGMDLDITIPGRINGTPATLLVNTGSAVTALTRTGAARRALPLVATGARVRGVGGRSRVYSVHVDEYVAASARAFQGFMPVIGDYTSPPAYDGVAGASFLLQSDVEFSLATKELRFYRPINCDASFLAYWDEGASELPFVYNLSHGRNPHFYVLLNGQKLRAAISSATGATVVTLGAAKRAGMRLDAPGVERAADTGGVGDAHVARWHTRFDTLQLGKEIIRDAPVAVIDSDDLGVDLLLGADFLRSHRVLFAMSQKKLYISYVGGPQLSPRRTMEPWMLKEAEGGNGDAQLALASMYARGDGVPKDTRQFQAWLSKADASGNPQANILVANWLIDGGEYGKAAWRLRAALDKLPTNRQAALWLYTTRLRTNEAELGRRELEASVVRADEDEWPVPIAHYFLGKLSEEKLLAAAAGERELAAARSCLARKHIAARHAALGDADRAKAVLAQQPGCSASAQ